MKAKYYNSDGENFWDSTLSEFQTLQDVWENKLEWDKNAL